MKRHRALSGAQNPFPFRVVKLAALGCAALGLMAQNIQPGHTQLKEGDMAPDFTLRSTAGEMVKLSDFRGKSNVVLAFFPAAFTGG